jgi:hypothetical protein
MQIKDKKYTQYVVFINVAHVLIALFDFLFINMLNFLNFYMILTFPLPIMEAVSSE